MSEDRISLPCQLNGALTSVKHLAWLKKATTLHMLPGHAKLTTAVRYTHMTTKTNRDIVSPYAMLVKLQDQTVKRSLEQTRVGVSMSKLEDADIFRAHGPISTNASRPVDRN